MHCLYTLAYEEGKVLSLLHILNIYQLGLPVNVAIERSLSEILKNPYKQLANRAAYTASYKEEFLTIVPLILQRQVSVPSPADLMAAVKDSLLDAASRWPSLTLIVEPGRSIIGNAATFITKVLGWKRNGIKRFEYTFPMPRRRL